MGCLRTTLMALCSAVLLVACAGGDDDNNDRNSSNVECRSNGDCPTGVICDLSTNRCQTTGNNNNPPNNTNTMPNNTNMMPNNTTGGVCGDGMVSGDETCDGGCPTECASTAPQCQTGQLRGSAEACTAECVYTDITACTSGDGCCPSGCTADNDDDCTAECGNGVLDPGENCDFGIMGGEGTCPVGPADCDDGNACTLNAVTGDVGMCTAQCVAEPIVVCVDDDGCCPGACDASNDNDCSPKIGQSCTADGDCPASMAGSAGFCQTEADYRWPGGFCSAGCMVDQDCATGEHCTGRVCMPDCTTNDDCRAGYECYDFYGTGTNTCAPAPTTGEPSGGACSSDDDCLGSLFGAVCNDAPGLPGGYCMSGCQVDADCAAGTHCGTTSAGGQICVPDCAVNQDCRAGYECFDWLGDFANTCGPVANGNGVVGEACTVLQDCAGGQDGFCISTPDWFEGSCSETCSSTNACPAGSHCAYIDPVSGQGACVADCTSGADCRTNYSCIDADDDQTTECAPTGDGSGVIGEACAGVYECAGGADAFCIQEAQGWRAGYCSASCTSNADCPAGSHCGNQNPTTGAGLCVADCTGDGDCRADGYTCFDWDSSTVASTECAPGGTGDGLQGEACEGVWECDGGAGAFCVTDDSGWPDGYCVLGGCTANADCSANAHCGFFDTTTGEGVCLGNCGTDADCRADYGCFDLDADQVPECLPEGDGPVGSSCGSFVDCGGRENAICAPDPGFPAGMCLLDCSPGIGTTCPANTACVAFLALSACVPSCTSNADCRAGYTCQNDGTGNQVCLP